MAQLLLNEKKKKVHSFLSKTVDWATETSLPINTSNDKSLLKVSKKLRAASTPTTQISFPILLEKANQIQGCLILLCWWQKSTRGG